MDFNKLKQKQKKESFDNNVFAVVYVFFENDHDLQEFAKLINRKEITGRKTWIWFPGRK